MPGKSCEKQTVAIVLGTRPEAIKLAPLVRALSASSHLDPLVISTGQHREMLDQMLQQLHIVPAEDLRVMRERQSLAALTSRLVDALSNCLRKHSPRAVVVQGDTTTAFAGALTAFYEHIPVAHVEAGLRSGQHDNPFPEELNRRLIGQVSAWHFAPTQSAAQHLMREGIKPAQIAITGNTGIDNLLWAINGRKGRSRFSGHCRKVLVTLHRRENQGEVMRKLAVTFDRLARAGDIEIVLPLHKSPAVREVIVPILNENPHVRLAEPLDYFDFTATMADCDLVLTDSGGVQEEAPSLGKPVLILRDNTERPEAIDAGVAFLVGVDGELVHKHTMEILGDAERYGSMARAVNPFGDGTAGLRIAERLERDLFSE